MILKECLTFFEKEERRIEEGNGCKVKEFRKIVSRIQRNIRMKPVRYRLGWDREEFFDKAVKQLIGQRLRGQVIIGSIAHSSLSFINVVKHIDRSIIVLGPGNKPTIYDFNITGPNWVEKHTRSKSRICIVPVQLARERHGQPEKLSMQQIKKRVLDFIANTPS